MEKKYIIYTISLGSEVMYVGCTCRLKIREWEHKNLRGTHKSAIPEDVDLSLITFNTFNEYNTKDEAIKEEDSLIVAYDTITHGWNKQRSGNVYSDVDYIKKKKKEYRDTHKTEIRAYFQVYQHTENGRNIHNEANRRYRQTENGKQKQREGSSRYYKRLHNLK